MTSLLQLNEPVIQVWSTPLADSRDSNTEEHFDPECGFIKQWEWIIHGSNKKFCLLIRRCVCRNETDKSHMLQKKILRPYEFGDGVELHLYSKDNSQKCDYSVKPKPRGNSVVYVHDKVCYC
ncbi:hypothetical protein ACJMK2_017426 [Sinanodonta woodiana]|uniref:Uncharacterized protein n=1 Tax=Sinanodonta woodiana TaxID=1069815 RepID=A0ABD3UCB5_SINWO